MRLFRFVESWYQAIVQISETSLNPAASFDIETDQEELWHVYELNLREIDRLVVVLNDHVSILNHEKDVLYIRNVET